MEADELLKLQEEWRKNSNIYKNLFPEIMLNMETLQKKINTTPSSFSEIRQPNHGFQIRDVLYKISENRYGKALADGSIKSKVAGMVTHVASSDIFTLMSIGIYDYPHLPYKDTSILYLSDRQPGKLGHYLDMFDKVYIPVGIYADDKIILNINPGVSGIDFRPYSDDVTETIFDTYSQDDLTDIIKVVLENAG